jgi:hypothetical protein
MFDGNQTDHSEGSAADLRDYVVQLQAERALASLEGLGHNATYLADLDEALAMAQHDYVVAAVVEIASLRAEIDGPLEG